MDSEELFQKTLRLLEGVSEEEPEVESRINQVFRNLIALKNKNKVNFDLESFIVTSWKDLEWMKSENSGRDEHENKVKEKKRVKKLLNLSVLRLWELMQREEHLEVCMDKLIELLELEFDSEVEEKGLKSFDFLEMVLNMLFLGDFYKLGVVQHFLINSRYCVQLPCALNNVIRNFQRTEKLNEILNKGRLMGKDTLYERCLIFVSKLKTPEEYSDRMNAPREEKLLKIPKKELALKNRIDYLEKNKSNTEETEYYEEDGSDYESDEDDDNEDEDGESDQGSGSEDRREEEGIYVSNYKKLWESILNELVYSLSDRNLVIVLESLPTLAFPYLHNPLRVVNFLYENLNNKREEVAINSLNCLFELILYHKLTDQMILGEQMGKSNRKLKRKLEGDEADGDEQGDKSDWFYSKLYEFVDFKYLSSGSNNVLVLLLEKALNSSMLPNELLSSFIKKMVKVASVLESNTCNCLLVISLGLLQKHYHNLLYLIHSPVKVENSKNGSQMEVEGEGFPVDDYCKYRGKEEELFLHELYLLLTHFNQDTAKIVGIYFTDLRSRDKVKFNVRDFLDNGQNTWSSRIEKSRKGSLNVFRGTSHRSTNLSKQFFQNL